MSNEDRFGLIDRLDKVSNVPVLHIEQGKEMGVVPVADGKHYRGIDQWIETIGLDIDA